MYNFQSNILQAEIKAKNTINPENKENLPEVKKQPIKQEAQRYLDQLTNTKWDPIKYQNVEQLKKPNVNIIFIGHVDAGKSTLCGRILKNLDQIADDSQTKKNQQSKKKEVEFNKLWTDVYEFERIRGKTVECSKTIITLPGRRYTVFDAPGHQNYVPSMIQGACQADLAILIISAQKGQYEAGFIKQGQTKEHAMLARSLGVKNMLCVVTKMGAANWDLKRFTRIRKEVSHFLMVACGYSSVKCVPVDSLADINIDKSNAWKECEWYEGENLLEALESAEVRRRSSTDPLRMPIVDFFREQGCQYIFGKIQSGVLVENQVVTMLPNKMPITIREIFNAKDQRLPYAAAGQNVKLKIKSIEETDLIRRGNVLCDQKDFCQICEEFQAKITVLELPASKLLSKGYECVLHLHAIQQEAKITAVKSIDQIQPKPINFLRSGENGIVRIKVDKAVCLEKYSKMEGLGCFTLRSEGKTVAYGEVMKIRPLAKQIVELKEKTQATTANKKASRSKK